MQVSHYKFVERSMNLMASLDRKNHCNHNSSYALGMGIDDRCLTKQHEIPFAFESYMHTLRDAKG